MYLKQDFYLSPSIINFLKFVVCYCKLTTFTRSISILVIEISIYKTTKLIGQSYLRLFELNKIYIFLIQLSTYLILFLYIIPIVVLSYYKVEHNLIL